MRSIVVAAVLFALAGCSDVQIVDDDGGAGGADTTGSTGSSNGAATTVSSGSGTPIANCTNDAYYVTVVGLSDQPFTYGCENQPLPTTQYQPGGACASGFAIDACGPPGGDDVTLFLPDGALGSGTVGQYVLTDVVFDLGPVGEAGELVRGQYEATAISPHGDTTAVLGLFSLCRLPDAPPCP